jgi:hypothetical protein
MSKFEELCSALKKYRQDWSNYRAEGKHFCMIMIDKYIKYLGIQHDKIDFVPLDKEPEPNKRYVITDAVHIDSDTFFHLGVRIILHEGDRQNRQERLLIKFMFKKIGNGKFLVKIDEIDPIYTINADNEDDFKTFFDFLQSQILEYYDDGLEIFLAQSKPRIGFSTGD